MCKITFFHVIKSNPESITQKPETARKINLKIHKIFRKFLRHSEELEEFKEYSLKYNKSSSELNQILRQLNAI